MQRALMKLNFLTWMIILLLCLIQAILLHSITGVLSWWESKFDIYFLLLSVRNSVHQCNKTSSTQTRKIVRKKALFKITSNLGIFNVSLEMSTAMVSSYYVVTKSVAAIFSLIWQSTDDLLWRSSSWLSTTNATVGKVQLIPKTEG